MVNTRSTFIPNPAAAMGLENLEKHGMLEIADLLPLDLDNPIHSIFEYSNWVGTPENLYRAISPALRLASLFITEHAFMDWWVIIATGTWAEGYENDRGEYEFLEPARRVLRAHTADTREDFNHLASRITFRWTEPWTLKGDQAMMNSYVHEGEGEEPDDITFDAQLNKQLGDFWFAQAHPPGHIPPPGLMQRTWFVIAVALVHELAHCFYAWHFEEEEHECYHSKADKQNEQGWSWEFFMFGRLIEVNDTEDWMIWSGVPTYGLHSTKWFSPQEGADADSNGAIMTAVPIKWVNQWFRRETWQRIEEEGRECVGKCWSRLHCQLNPRAPCGVPRYSLYETADEMFPQE